MGRRCALWALSTHGHEHYEHKKLISHFPAIWICLHVILVTAKCEVIRLYMLSLRFAIETTYEIVWCETFCLFVSKNLCSGDMLMHADIYLKLAFV